MLEQMEDENIKKSEPSNVKSRMTYMSKLGIAGKD